MQGNLLLVCAYLEHSPKNALNLVFKTDSNDIEFVDENRAPYIKVVRL